MLKWLRSKFHRKPKPRFILVKDYTGGQAVYSIEEWSGMLTQYRYVSNTIFYDESEAIERLTEMVKGTTLDKGKVVVMTSDDVGLTESVDTSTTNSKTI